MNVKTSTSAVRVKEINCTQYAIEDDRTPLLPPNQFRYIDSRTDITVDNSDDARSLYQRYRLFNSNRYNRRKFVNGALYTSLFPECTDILCPTSGEVIKLDVLLQNRIDRTTITIHYDGNVKRSELLAMTDMGESMSSYGNNTSRGTNFDGGKMNIVGSGKKGNGSYGTYNLSNISKNIEIATMAVTSIVKGYYEEIGFSQEMNEMNNQRLHGQMNDKNFFTSAIVQSQNLVNAAHYDVDDKTMSIATWTELDIGKAINWYFILPNVTRDGHKGIAIKLRNGVTIAWDGRTIFHCSTVGDVGMANNVYGTFFGGKT